MVYFMGLDRRMKFIACIEIEWGEIKGDSWFFFWVEGWEENVKPKNNEFDRLERYFLRSPRFLVIVTLLLLGSAWNRVPPDCSTAKNKAKRGLGVFCLFEIVKSGPHSDWATH